MLIGKRVKKVGGSFQHTGVVVAEFTTTAGMTRDEVMRQLPGCCMSTGRIRLR